VFGEVEGVIGELMKGLEGLADDSRSGGCGDELGFGLV
jgi:hypothetical protein